MDLPERARWAREERPVVSELGDGSVMVELGFAGVDWLVREMLKEAGDAVVLEPADARDAVRAAAEAIAAAAARSPQYVRDRPIAASSRCPARRRAAGFVAEQRTVICATNGAEGRHTDATLVHGRRGADLGLDLRQVAEGAEPGARPRATLQIEAGDAYERTRGVMIETEVEIHRDTELVASSGPNCSRATAHTTTRVLDGMPRRPRRDRTARAAVQTRRVAIGPDGASRRNLLDARLATLPACGSSRA